MADLSAYWHEKARGLIASGHAKRAGLLATQSIRGGGGRRILERMKESGDIFMAWADEPWILAGANVHISFVAYDDGSETHHVLNGQQVDSINPNLTAGVDLTVARRLPENAGIAFIADVKGGPFEIPESLASEWLRRPNPDGRSNRDVLAPWVNGQDITRRSRGMWIIDFGTDMSENEAALYEAPFEYARWRVKLERDASRTTQRNWWLHERPGHSMRRALAGLTRYLATPILTKHRLFVWLPAGVLADHQLVAIARDDDYTFGVLHSRVHELWARGMGTQLREVQSGFRYTPTTTFETFPFPHPTEADRSTISEAAKRLVELRNGWLNPPSLAVEDLATRTLTNLYNERPAWLVNAHDVLDAAVLAAYGWPFELADGDILARLLALNLEREPA